MDRAAENHYPTSETTAIAAREVRKLALDHCALFLWATVPMLPDALTVMEAWGFGYVTHWVWMKDRVGTGYWNRNAHELLLLGTRGNVPAPAPGTQWPSVILARPTEHSAKPERFHELIEAYFPNLPKIELNRRGPARPGWDAWGNEAETEEDGAHDDDGDDHDARLAGGDNVYRRQPGQHDGVDGTSGAEQRADGVPAQHAVDQDHRARAGDRPGAAHIVPDTCENLVDRCNGGQEAS